MIVNVKILKLSLPDVKSHLYQYASGSVKIMKNE